MIHSGICYMQSVHASTTPFESSYVAFELLFPMTSQHRHNCPISADSVVNRWLMKKMKKRFRCLCQKNHLKDELLPTSLWRKFKTRKLKSKVKCQIRVLRRRWMRGLWKFLKGLEIFTCFLFSLALTFLISCKLLRYNSNSEAYFMSGMCHVTKQ